MTNDFDPYFGVRYSDSESVNSNVGIIDMPHILIPRLHYITFILLYKNDFNFYFIFNSFIMLAKFSYDTNNVMIKIALMAG